MLSTAAALPREDIHIKAMIAFMKGYNCFITEPKFTTDAWVGLRDGHLHMKQDAEDLLWPLLHKDQTARYVATPVCSVTVEPLSQAFVTCTGEGPAEEDADRLQVLLWWSPWEKA
jgi:hypothetical protein